MDQTLGIQTMLEVIEVDNLNELESYRLTWNALLPQTQQASFFHTFRWLRTYWKHYGSDQRLIVLIIRSHDTTIGIVPLCVRTERYNIGKVRVLTYPLNDWGTWYGPIGPNPSACLAAAFDYLRQRERSWDMIDLRWVPHTEGSHNSTENAMHLAGWSPNLRSSQQVSIIKFAGSTWSEYFGQLSKKWRHEIRRQSRVLERNFEVTFERHRPSGSAYGDDNPNWNMFQECVEVSRQSWQSQSQSGNTLCHNYVLDFLRTCHEIAAREGMVDMAILRLNNEPVAFQYNYIYDGRLYGLRMGFNKAFTPYGVGKVLLLRFIEDSFERGDQLMDLGIGDFDFKRRLRTGIETNYQISCYPNFAFRPQAVRLTRWIKERIPVRSKRSLAKNK